MSKSIDEAYRASLGKDSQLDLADKSVIGSCIPTLKLVYNFPGILSKAEAVALAKKLLSRAAKKNWTRAEVEAFLKG